MAHYEIKQYSYDQARKHGYVVKVSTNKKKKIDLCKDNVKICTIGDILYKDYPTYIQKNCQVNLIRPPCDKFTWLSTHMIFMCI